MAPITIGYYALWPNDLSLVGAPLNADIKGIMLLADWSKLEPQDGAYDWSTLDLRLQEATDLGLVVFLGLVHSPMKTPIWLIQNSAVQTIGMLDTNPDRKSFCTAPLVPVFWDPTFHVKRLALVAAAGKRYNANPVIQAVSSCGINFYGDGWELPMKRGGQICAGQTVQLNQIKQWLDAGYQSATMLRICQEIIQAVAAAFPDKSLKFSYNVTTKELDGTVTALASQLLQYGYSQYPSRFHAQLDDFNTLSLPASDIGVSASLPLHYSYLRQLLQQYSVTKQVGARLKASATENSHCRLSGDIPPCEPYPTFHAAIEIVRTYWPKFVEVASDDAQNLILGTAFEPLASPGGGEDAIVLDSPISATSYMEIIAVRRLIGRAHVYKAIPPTYPTDPSLVLPTWETSRRAYDIQRDLLDQSRITTARSAALAKSYGLADFSPFLRDFNLNTIEPIGYNDVLKPRSSVVLMDVTFTDTDRNLVLQHFASHREILPSRVVL